MAAGKTHVPLIETHLIRSEHVAQTFKIEVMQPVQQRGEATRFPVVYVTDGNLAFDVLKGIALSLQLAERQVPRFMVVGIGYPGESPLAGAVLRARDFTFPGYPKLSTEPPPIEGVLVDEPGAKDFYGAEDFQRFIERELVPLIDGRYRTIPGDRTYFGHSVAGGFGLFTLFTQAHLFKNYIVSSPGLVYHGTSSAGVHYDDHDFVLQDARRFVASGTSLDGTRLFMSVGTAEEFEPNLAQWRLTSSFHRLVALMKAGNIPGLQFTAETFPGATHMTAWPLAFIDGVKCMFGTEQRK